MTPNLRNDSEFSNSMSHSQIQCPTHVHWDTREVAYEHPDADADCIAAAYDAFEREHGD
jgi:hypothetical protein